MYLNVTLAVTLINITVVCFQLSVVSENRICNCSKESDPDYS